MTTPPKSGKSGLEVHFVIDRTGQPDFAPAGAPPALGAAESPDRRRRAHRRHPVVMVRDAQHLTSAFKMDQTAFDRWESSVPSDRFYDDFSLEFAPLERDSIHPGCFYYSLTAESAQRTVPTSIRDASAPPIATEPRVMRNCAAIWKRPWRRNAIPNRSIRFSFSAATASSRSRWWPASTKKRRCSNISRGSNGSATASATSTTSAMRTSSRG